MTDEKNLENRTLLTDTYQLTMDAGYFDSKKDDEATFELFIRNLPKDWGYFIANGIEDAIDYSTNIGFTDSDLDYLRSTGKFREDYLGFLKNFKFEGEICAVREGTPVAPNEPLLRVKAKRTQAQLLETMLLNTVNFQTMIATKTNRVVNAAGNADVIEFGCRRAQEKDAALKGSRAAFIGGAIATSNVLAGKIYGVPISGTHAHSWVMSFPTELDAFRAYVVTFPDNATLLIDTYDTISGAKNAVIVAKELEKMGLRLGGVRLDSGDIPKLSREVRKIFDESGVNYLKISASNDLNEYLIADIMAKGKVNAFGVGTEMITAKPTSAIPGVYKLVEDCQGPRIKLSSNKITYPGAKQVYRIADRSGKYLYDVLALESEKIDGIPLLEKVVESGRRISERRPLAEIRKYALDCVSRLPDEAKQLYAVPYVMKTSQKLDALVSELSGKYGIGGQK